LLVLVSCHEKLDSKFESAVRLAFSYVVAAQNKKPLKLKCAEFKKENKKLSFENRPLSNAAFSHNTSTLHEC
jgi:hypothetical protein